jgi:hypothetical protein
MYSPFFFMVMTITGIVYLDMLQQFLIPQLDEDDQDRTPPHYLGEVCEYFSTHFPGWWIGRAALIAWSPCSPDLTPLEFFLCGFVKDEVFVPHSPANVIELQTRITATVAEVMPEMLFSYIMSSKHCACPLNKLM